MSIPDTSTFADESHSVDVSIFQQSDVVLKGQDGRNVAVSDIVDSSGMLILVFIRHFSCGSCSNYVEALGKNVSKE